MKILSEETQYPLGDKNERPMRAKSMIVLSKETWYLLGDKNERPLRAKSVIVLSEETQYMHAIDKMKHILS